MNVALAPRTETEGNRDSLPEQLFVSMGVDGVYARTALYEQVVGAIGRLITLHREPNTETFRFPPVMSRKILERSGYLKSFPHLLGCVSCLEGSEADIRGVVDRFEEGEPWTHALAASDLVLSPASCYPIYPLAANRGNVPDGGLIFDVAADCFRHEPSRDRDRLQSFRMREYVCIGTPEQVAKFRARWMARISAIAEELELTHRVDPASDPFFGRGGMLMAKTQVEQSLKYELLIPISKTGKPTACMSVNYHRDHFGGVWNLHNACGEVSHTGCVAFGMDRIALAMFATHGLNPAEWPEPVLVRLGMQS